MKISLISQRPRYSKDFICKSLHRINEDIRKTGNKISELSKEAAVEKQKMKDVILTIERLWSIRLDIMMEKDRLKCLKSYVRQLNMMLNERYNIHNQENKRRLK